MRRTIRIVSEVVLATCFVAALVAAAGCSGGDNYKGPPAETQQKSSRLEDIQKKTGGDWNKLSAEDKDYLVNTISHGSESTAKMLIEAGGQTPQGGPGRPANAGAPGGSK